MALPDLIKTYIEIGVLGMCAILTVVVTYLNVKRGFKREEDKDKRIDNKDDQNIKDKDKITEELSTLINVLKEQNKMYQDRQLKNNEILISSLVSQITKHTPSKEENDKITDISREIDELLDDILIKTKASRAFLVQYHNGGRGINKQSFLKMSMTNERLCPGVKPFITQFKDQFRSSIPYFTQSIETDNYCYIDNLDDLQNIDNGTFEFLKYINVYAKYGYGIRSNEGSVIGFICIEYNNPPTVDKKFIDECFKQNIKAFETLLNL